MYVLKNLRFFLNHEIIPFPGGGFEWFLSRTKNLGNFKLVLLSVVKVVVIGLDVVLEISPLDFSI